MAKKTNNKKTVKNETVEVTEKIVNEMSQDTVNESNEEDIKEDVKSVSEVESKNMQEGIVETNDNIEDIEEVSIENVTEELVENKNEIKEEKINTTAPKKQITTSEMFGYHWMGQIFDY